MNMQASVRRACCIVGWDYLTVLKFILGQEMHLFNKLTILLGFVNICEYKPVLSIPLNALSTHCCQD